MSSSSDLSAKTLRLGARSVLSAALVLLSISAFAQTTFVATRTSGFAYYGASDGVKNGLLKSETVEPGSAQRCVTTSYTYDSYGNKSAATTSNCAGASGQALFTSRTSGTTYPTSPTSQTISVMGSAAVVTVPAGQFATAATNAASQSEARTYDPRFGAALTLTGPNALTTSWVYDDFGRKIQELRADGTSTVAFYCYLVHGSGGSVSIDTSVPSSTGCPTPAAAEVPLDAVSFVHSEPHDTTGAKMGPFVRVYTDRLGRQLRSATEGFDGASQPSPGAIIVKDTVYNQYGAKVIETQPYFLATGSTTSGGSNDVGATFVVYDLLGRPTDLYASDLKGKGPSTTSGPFASLGFASGGSVSYGVYITSGTPTAHTATAYSGLSTTTTNDQSQTRRQDKNLIGEVILVTDAAGAQLAQQRDAFGNLVATKDALQNTVALSFDVRGRKTQLIDPDTGTWNYAYDALGQLVWQQSPNELVQGTSVATTMTYDVLGRMTSRIEPEYTSTWSYDKYADGSACSKGVGKLCESKTSTGIDRRVVYDTLGRPSSSRTDTGVGPSFAGALTYSVTTARLAVQTYPTGLQIQYNYTSRGSLQSLTLQTAATVNPLPDSQGHTASSISLPAGSALWTAQVANAWGKAEQQKFGNGVVGSAIYEAATGRVTSLVAGAAGAVLNQQYSWDSLNNLTGRTDQNGDTSSGVSTGAVTETFVYGDNSDNTKNINRLSSYTVTAPQIPGLSRTVSLQYNALGMLLYKSDVGVYAYGQQNTLGVKPHALQSMTAASATTYTYDANGNLTSASAGKYRSISYTSFNLPDSQTGMQGPSGLPKYTWRYDESHARISEIETTSAGTRTTWYMHPDNAGGLNFESETAASGTISNRHFLSAGGQAFGVLISTGALPTLGAQLTPPTIASITLVKVEYWHKDHLGSLVATTDHTGAVTQRYAYDPFGKRRYTNGSYDEFGNVVVDWSSTLNSGTSRGFTGHEGLDDIGLVNMNGRIFDPTLGVFLQGDPLIQDPLNLQNYDRYGYCYNNPLTCTDPSGQSFFSDLFGHIIHDLSKLDPIGSHLAKTKLGYAVGEIAIGIVSLYCGPGYVACVAGASQLWAGAAGMSFDQANRVAVVSAATAYAFHAIGDIAPGAGQAGASATSIAENTLGHVLVGCLSSVAGGGKCGSGAIAAGISAAYGNYGPGYGSGADFAGRVQGAAISALVGGTASVAAGGKFGNGAITSAFGYLFNDVTHEVKDDGHLQVVPGNPQTDAAYDRLQLLADTAAATVDANCDWRCAFPWIRGTLIHTAFEALVTALGPTSGFTAEVSYKDGVVVPYGTAGSSRADAVFGPVAAPIVVFDLKTGWAFMGMSQARAYGNNLPSGTPFTIIRPKGG